MGRRTLRGLAATVLAASVLVLVAGASPSSAASAPFSDDFNRADSTDLGSNWVETGGGLQIAGNKLTSTNASPFDLAVVSDLSATHVEADIAANPTPTAEDPYVALVVNHASADEQIFVAFRENIAGALSADGTFDRLQVLRGNGAGGVLHEEIVPSFSSGHVVVTTDGASVTISLDGTVLETVAVAVPTGGFGVGVGIFNGGTVDNFSATVDSLATDVALSASPEPSSFGQSTTFTATVSREDGGATPTTGSITFTIGGQDAGPFPVDANGQAFTTVDDLPVGGTAVSAAYTPDATALPALAPSTVGPVTHTVDKAATTLTVVSDHQPSQFGQTVTFTATVGALDTIPSPDGNVVFTVDSEAPTTVALTDGVATLPRSDLTIGAHTVTASYAGSTNYAAAADDSVTQNVNRVDTSTSVVSDTNPSTFGTAVTFTATVTGLGGAPVTSGTVTFATGGNALGADVGVDASGQASVTVSNLNPGDHSITATYNPSATTNSSTGTVLQHVDKATPGVAVSASPTPSVFGQSVTFTATITSGVAPATGTVTFKEGATVLAQDVAVVNGSATFTTSSLSVGAHTIDALYSGSDLLESSTGQGTHTVSQADSTTTIESSDEPAGSGQQVTFTITVGAAAPGSGTPTGSVHLSINGSAPVDVTLTDGEGTFTVPFNSIGTFPITATYDGDASFTGSSGSFTQTVVEAFTTTTLTSSEADNVSSYGQPVTFTAAVTSNGSAPAEGSAELFDGDTSLGTAVVSNAPVNFEIAGLTVGDHGLKVVFSGSTSSSPSSSATLTHSVVQSDTAVTVSDAGGFSINVTVARSTAGASAAAVAGPAVKAPSGEVKVLENGTEVGKGTLTDAGTAQISMQGLSAGAHALTITYAGDTNNKAASTTFQKTVSEATAAGAAGSGAGAVARTGTNSGPLFFGGLLLVTVGAGALGLAADLRRRRRRPVPSQLA